MCMVRGSMMRDVIFVAVVIVTVVMLTGCSVTSGADGQARVTISGTVLNAVSGLPPAGNSEVRLLHDGALVSSVTIDSAGDFAFTNIPDSDVYALEVLNPDARFMRTVVGPFTTRTRRDFTIVVYTAEQLALLAGVAPPDAGAATLVVFGDTATGAGVPVHVVIDTNTQTADGNPAVLVGLSPGTHDVTVTDLINGDIVTVHSLSLPTGEITVLRVPAATPEPVKITGTVQSALSNYRYAKVIVNLRRDGTLVASTTTDYRGAFALYNIPAGSGYVLEVLDEHCAIVRTLFGPLALCRDLQNIRLNVYTPVQFNAEFGIGYPPTTSTATLAVLLRIQPDLLVPVIVRIDDRYPSAPGTPAILTGIPPAVYDITVIADATPRRSTRLHNINLSGGSLTLLRISGRALGFDTDEAWDQ